MFIDGRWVSSMSKKTDPIINPADESVIARVPRGTKKDVDHAVKAARKAFENDWRFTTGGERGALLWKLADLLEENAKHFAELESRNTGKTIRYATESDLPMAIDNLRFFAGATRCLEGKPFGEYANYMEKNRRMPLGSSWIRREPLGVIGAIVPWNYPLLIAVWKIGPVLAAGNTLVIKPASLTPITLLELAKLAEKAGFPKGVLNVVTGPGKEVGEALASHGDVNMIYLTGNIETGKILMNRATKNMKRVHLELGGKAPQVILPDADIEAAARAATAGAFWNTGQDCTAITRVYVHEDMHDAFLKLLLREVKKMVMGDPSKDTTDLGPLVSAAHRDRVERFIREGKKKARLVCGGNRLGAKGFFVEPTIFTDVPHTSDLCQKEIFGPVLSIFRYKKVDDALQKANDTIYGLAASVWGKDMTTLIRSANMLQFGTVWINEHGALVSEMPHGGFKQSGFGKDLSLYALEECTQIKHIYVDQTGLAKKPWHATIYHKA